jgi:short subunit dehydrogenase-like uncharacterized protein
MLYGAAGYTGTLIAHHAHQRGHRPLLTGRNAPGVAALGERLGLPHQAVALDDPAAPADPGTDDRHASPSSGPGEYRSFGWARATGPDGATAQAVLQTGESYRFTAGASIRAVEETLTRSPRGAFSPAAAFGSDFALTVPDTTRIDMTPAGASRS